MSWYYHALSGQAKELDAALYAAWVAAGNAKAAAYMPIADPPSPNAHYDGQQWIIYEPTIEQRRAAMTCTPRQARLALSQQGLLSAVEAFVAAGSEALKIEWQYATEIRRTWPPVAEFAVATDLSDETLDALFELAATL